MLKRLFVSLFVFIVIAFPAFSEELCVEKNKLYLLSFDEEILNFHSNNEALNVQIINTIFDDKKHLLISLRGNENGILQIKTENNFYNYEIVNGNKASNNIVEIDAPPLENLDVDIYTGD